MNVIGTGRVPVKNWASQIEGGALEQALNLANLPFSKKWIALMPDAHQGYGMPIGGVLFAEKAIVPYAVGVDIGCGVSLIETDLNEADLPSNPEFIKQVLHQVSRDVPVGNGPRGGHRKPEGEPFGFADAGNELLDKIIAEADLQLGTLGGGNHFIEIQADEDGRIWAMLHSGSRSVGKKVCDHHYKIAKHLCDVWHVELPDRELAFLPWETTEAREYWHDMTVAMAWAEENRRRMAGKVISAFGVGGVKAWQVLDVHHNYAAWENHYGQNGIVHRKGAVRAAVGERVLIPGSMGTGSYIAEGLGNPESFETCQHGAGRARSRAATRKEVSLAQMQEQMAAAGVMLVTPDPASVTDESAFAYKDIDQVMADSADLVKPITRLRPLGVVKG